jgi:hypothetical protein
VDLPYEASVEQLFDFFTDEVLPLNGLLSGPLLDRSGVGVDLQVVLNHLPRDPGICDGCQANTSTLSRRKVTSVSSYLLSRSPEIRVVCIASVLTCTVFMGMSSLPEGCTRGAEAESRWRELDGAGS